MSGAACLVVYRKVRRWDRIKPNWKRHGRSSTNQSYIPYTMKTTEQRKRFRVTEIYESGESGVIWTGKAWDCDGALERCFGDETPGGLCRYRVESWGMVKISRSMKSPGWVFEWEGKV